MTRYFQPGLIWWAGWAGVTFTLGCGRRTFSASGNWGSDPVLACPTVKRGAKARWFYGFYPGHLALLWVAQQIFR